MFNNVLLTVNLARKEEQQPALRAARKYIDEGSNLYVVSVIPALDSIRLVQSFLPAGYDKDLIDKGKKELHKFTKEHLPNVSNIKHLVLHGKIYEKVTNIAKQLDIDLIITMASTKDDRKSNNFGPNVARIVRNSNCSILVLR